MPVLHKLFFMLALINFMSGCATAPAKQHEYNAISGEERMLRYFIGWDSDCETRHPRIKFIDKPDHGTLAFKESQRQIGSSADIGNNQNCNGKTVLSKDLYYTPDAKFKGVDEFELEFTVPGTLQSVRQNIVVTVN